MKKGTVKQALSAHGWVGLVISLPLFVAFWAGSITLFLPEVLVWAKAPYYPVEQTTETPLTINQIVEAQIDNYAIPQEESIFVTLPSDKSPYLELFFQVPKQPSEAQINNTSIQDEGAENQTSEESPAVQVEKERKHLIIDPYTGKLFTDHSPFELAHFINVLHYTLHVPQGLYIFGIISLLFFVIIITGVIVQLKNLVKNFFLYRHTQTKRSQMNDLHTVVGVISLPYMALFAITGVILNLSILFIFPTSMTLYAGNQEGLLQDAGFAQFVPDELSGEARAVPNILPIVNEAENKYDTKVTGFSLYHYGDETAAIQFRGTYNDTFNSAFESIYSVKSGTFPAEYEQQANVFREGLNTVFSMHFANFGATDIRIVYFILAMLVCGMIAAGNVLWIVKREKRNAYPKTLAVARASTLGSCIGIMTATAFAFLLERVLPEAVNQREHLIEYAFGLILLLVVIVACFYQNVRRFVGFNLFACSGLLLLTLLFEWTVFGKILVSSSGLIPVTLYVSLGMATIAVVLMMVGLKILKLEQKSAATIENESELKHLKAA